MISTSILEIGNNINCVASKGKGNGKAVGADRIRTATIAISKPILAYLILIVPVFDSQPAWFSAVIKYVGKSMNRSALNFSLQELNPSNE